MAQKKGGGIGSAIGCLVVLGVIGFALYHFFPQIRALFPGSSPPVEWGQAHMGGGLRVAVIEAGVATTEVEDALGEREGNVDLHVTLEITNLGDSDITYRVPQLLRASEPKLIEDSGHEVKHVTYGDKARVVGQLEDKQTIASHDRETHDILFKVPPADAKSFLLNVDMAMFGGRGVVQFRIPADKIKGR